MGSPSAQTYLGFKMSGSYDSPDGEFWGNSTIGMQMLQCALAQGYGDAAYELGGLYKGTTPDSKLRALNVLHEGVKLGCAKCAKDLASEFRGYDLTSGNNLIGHIDTERATRYFKLGEALEHYQGRLKLPNLDKVLPLPPAPLPKWDGNVQTLIDAAKAVTPPPTAQQGTALQGREYIPHGYAVLPLAQNSLAVTGNQVVPRDGYWLALYGAASTPKNELIPARANTPERYKTGERFEAPFMNWLSADQVQWHYLGEPYPVSPVREDFLKIALHAGWLRQVPDLPSPLQCDGLRQCPRTGIWEGHITSDHPMAALYNRWNQQAFLEKGQAFPKPGERFVDVAIDEVQWTYLGSPNAETGMSGVREIDL
jgi:hypothetical protein